MGLVADSWQHCPGEGFLSMAEVLAIRLPLPTENILGLLLKFWRTVEPEWEQERVRRKEQKCDGTEGSPTPHPPMPPGR